MAFSLTGIGEVIGGALKAVGAYFEWALMKMKLKNSPEMQQREKAKNDQALRDRVNDLIRKSVDYARENPGKYNPYEAELKKLSS